MCRETNKQENQVQRLPQLEQNITGLWNSHERELAGKTVVEAISEFKKKELDSDSVEAVTDERTSPLDYISVNKEIKYINSRGMLKDNGSSHNDMKLNRSHNNASYFVDDLENTNSVV